MDAEVTFVPVARWRLLWIPAVFVALVALVYGWLALTASDKSALGPFGLYIVFVLLLGYLGFGRRLRAGMSKPPLGFSAAGLHIRLPREKEPVTVPWENVHAGWVAGLGPASKPREHVCFALSALASRPSRNGLLVTLSGREPRYVAVFLAALGKAPHELDTLVREASGNRVTLLPTLPPDQPAPLLRAPDPEDAVVLVRRSRTALVGLIVAIAFFAAAAVGLVAGIVTTQTPAGWLDGLARPVFLGCIVAGFVAALVSAIAHTFFGGLPRTPVARLTADGIDLPVAARHYSVHLPWSAVRSAQIVTAPAALASPYRPVRVVAIKLTDWDPRSSAYVRGPGGWFALVRDKLGVDAVFPVRDDHDLAAVRAAIGRYTGGRVDLAGDRIA